jgi:Domain of unknown function (DUF4037)
MPDFIPGLRLSRLFYENQVQPILKEYFRKLRYSAALLGWGSEVLGFDTALSRDHHWGPRVLLFLNSTDFPKFQPAVSQTLSNRLPYEFMGYSTNFSAPEPNGVRHPVKIKSGPVNHMVNIYTPQKFFQERLGIDPTRKIKATDWLTMRQQRLLEAVSGEVFNDGLGQLGKIRERLKFYPHDIWLYILAAQWKRISEEEAFVGRAGEVGNELSSQIVAARLVREVMRLALLMEKQYAPYSKWLGSAFNKLQISKKLGPVLGEVLLAENWKAREMKLGQAYTIMASQHNALKITKALPTKVTKYFNRPYLVIHGDDFANEIRKAIKDPQVKKITTDIGAVDQFTDSRDLTIEMARQLGVVYKT